MFEAKWVIFYNFIPPIICKKSLISFLTTKVKGQTWAKGTFDIRLQMFESTLMFYAEL